jgi:integrase
MSVHKRKYGTWQVRYRDANGVQRADSFDTKRLAVEFDAEQKLRRRHPQMAAQERAQKMTLKQYVEGPWRQHSATFEQPTRDKYRWALECHLADLAGEKLVAIDVERLSDVQVIMLEGGATPTTVREVLAKLAAIFEVAISQGYLPPGANPVKAVRKPPAKPRDEPNILAPAALEEKIASLSGRDRAIAILGGRGGLSPKEIKLVRWADFDGEQITVGASRTKSSRARTRMVTLDQLSRQQLKEWRLAAGRPPVGEPIIGSITHDEFRRWHLRHLPAGVRLTDLRHSHASALHHTKMSQPAILRRLGHGFQAHWRHYAHVIDSIPESERYDDLEALYAAARPAPTAHITRTPGVKT